MTAFEKIAGMLPQRRLGEATAREILSEHRREIALEVMDGDWQEQAHALGISQDAVQHLVTHIARSINQEIPSVDLTAMDRGHRRAQIGWPALHSARQRVRALVRELGPGHSGLPDLACGVVAEVFAEAGLNPLAAPAVAPGYLADAVREETGTA